MPLLTGFTCGLGKGLATELFLVALGDGRTNYGDAFQACFSP